MRVKYHKKIYQRKAVKAGVDAFKEIVAFRIEENKDYYLVRNNKMKSDEAKILDELSNYILFNCR